MRFRKDHDRALLLGQENRRAIRLLSNHCTHAEVEVSPSFLGHRVNLPIGTVHVRCPHAPETGAEGANALELAIDFCERSCGSCAHHSPTGVLPTIMVEVTARRHAREEDAARAASAMAERTSAWRGRKALRAAAAASGGVAVRELVRDLESIDPDPSGELDRAVYDEAARRIAETARRAPELFSDALADTLAGSAREIPDPTVWSVLKTLADAGVGDAALIGDAAVTLLTTYPLPEAGDCLASVVEDVPLGRLRSILPTLVELAAGKDLIFDQIRSAPAALLAAFSADRDAVVERLAGLLRSADEQERADAADATRILLSQGNQAIFAGLAIPLVESIHEPDTGYGGEPHPSASAMRALATAWRYAPSEVRGLIESYATRHASEEIREELFRVIHFLWRGREENEPDLPSDQEATDFLMQRLLGDWGESIATDASTQLATVADRAPGSLLQHADRLLGELISVCKPHTVLPSPIVTLDQLQHDPFSKEKAFLEHVSLSAHVDRRRYDLARILGALVRLDPDALLPRVRALLEAQSGDPDVDRTVRRALLRSLACGVSLANAPRLVPILYTHLLSPDQSARASAIELWHAIARVVEILPEELAVLATSLLRDEFVVVHRTMLQNLRGLGLPDQVLATLFDGLEAYAHFFAASSDPRVGTYLDDALRDLLYVADRACSPNQQLRARRIALMHIPSLDESDRERWLLDDRLTDLRPHPLWALQAWRTFVSSEHGSDYRRAELLAALLETPKGLVSIDIDELRRFGRSMLPRAYGAAIYGVELLQLSGRFSDATALALELRDTIPKTRAGDAAREYLELVAAAAALEEDATAGAARERLRSVLSAAPQGGDFEAYARARLDVLDALNANTASDPAPRAILLEQAASTIGSAQTAGLSDRKRQSLGDALRTGAQILRYDDAVRKADPSADTHLNAAKRNATILLASVESLSGFEAHREFLVSVGSLASPSDIDRTLRALFSISVPLPLCVAAREVVWPAVAERNTPPEPPPIAVCIFLIDGMPITDVAVLRRDHVYDLTLEMRIEEWPDWADTCEAAFLPVLSANGLTLPTFRLEKQPGEQTPAGLRLTASGSLQCDIARQIGLPPIDFPLLLRFSGSEREERADVAGYRRLLVRPFDPSRDQLTEHPQFDERLLKLFDSLKEDRSLDPDDVAAFCRLFAGCARAAQKIMFDRTFRKGTKVSETQFHDALERLLRDDPELDGRLSRRDAVAGGFDDLRHDNIIAELKVEREKPATVESSARYLGQPTQYGVGQGSRLSILVVLDHAKKEAPPGVLENYVGWLLPAHHGLTDPMYPSRVGVLIVNTNLPVPSAWARRRRP